MTGWESLLGQSQVEFVTAWVGGRTVRSPQRGATIHGALPPEFGWHRFRFEGRTARWLGPSDVPCDPQPVRACDGYLVGDLFLPDTTTQERWCRFCTRFTQDPICVCGQLTLYAVRAYDFSDTPRERFTPVRAARLQQDVWVVVDAAFPRGPEAEVRAAFEDGRLDLDHIQGVTPSLDAAYRLETWRRIEAERRRAALEAQRVAEAAAREAAERHAALVAQVGSAAVRRELAAVDFEAAARAALVVGDAEYLDHRVVTRHPVEYAVRFRTMNRRFECLVDARLSITDAGVCLTDEETGYKYDQELTLESLPPVLREAIRQGRLVVWRHV